MRGYGVDFLVEKILFYYNYKSRLNGFLRKIFGGINNNRI